MAENILSNMEWYRDEDRASLLRVYSQSVTERAISFQEAQDGLQRAATPAQCAGCYGANFNGPIPQNMPSTPVHTRARFPLMSATCFDTPIGLCAIAWDADEITRFSLPPARARRDTPPPWVDAIVARVRRHLAGEAEDFAGLPYAWNRVSSFQHSVYEAALQVKSGQTWSYGQLAAAIGQPPSAARSVGAALGQNPWPLLVPCHRFIASDGRMTGFSAPGGIKTKLRLLAIEGAELFAE